MQGAVVSLVNGCAVCVLGVCGHGCWDGKPWEYKLESGLKDIFDRRAAALMLFIIEERDGLGSWWCCGHRDWGHFLPVRPWVIPHGAAASLLPLECRVQS